MTDSRQEELLQRDWGESWDTLEQAPPLHPRGKTAQITMRLPAGSRDRLKRVARAKGLPYHALVRSWIVEGLRRGEAGSAPDAGEPQIEQLNIKLEHELLDELKSVAAARSQPYHRLARQWVQLALESEERRLGLDSRPAGQPVIKDLMVLLLHAPNARGQDAVRGITRLQKLLFVVEQTLATGSARFYAYQYGPFDEGVNDAAQALKLAGFLGEDAQPPPGPPSFQDMMASAKDRSGPKQAPQADEFALNRAGHEAAERLRSSSRAYEQLYRAIHQIREEWDTPELLERVYETWPKYTERSLIADEVAQRRRRRRK